MVNSSSNFLFNNGPYAHPLETLKLIGKSHDPSSCLCSLCDVTILRVAGPRSWESFLEANVTARQKESKAVTPWVGLRHGGYSGNQSLLRLGANGCVKLCDFLCTPSLSCLTREGFPGKWGTQFEICLKISKNNIKYAIKSKALHLLQDHGNDVVNDGARPGHRRSNFQPRLAITTPSNQPSVSLVSTSVGGVQTVSCGEKCLRGSNPTAASAP